jgi:hypothetical protein
MHRADIGPSIQKLLEDKNGVELGAGTYARIGDFIVEFAGSRS